jgi:hypothetical protein
MTTTWSRDHVKAMACRLCNTPLYAQWLSSGAYCARCIDTALTMTRMATTSHPTASVTTTTTKPSQGMTMDMMLTRINGHSHYGQLSQSVRETLQYIGRFDKRRTKEHNDYIRRVWQYLQEMKRATDNQDEAAVDYYEHQHITVL